MASEKSTPAEREGVGLSKTSEKIESSPKPTETAVAAETGKGKPGKFATVLDIFPPWVKMNLTKPRSLKTLARCWLASWVAFVIILPDASLNTLGNAAFFALLGSFFIPPNLPVQLTVFMMLTLIIGICFSWGIGVAAMRAANAVRSTAVIQAAEAQIQASIKNNPVFQANPSLASTTAIFNGAFLDVRSSAIYGSFLGFFAFFLALIRSYSPKLTYTSIFATIGLDIFCSIGPLIPTADYTLLKSLIIAIACYGAIALVTTFCVFPETMSHSALRSVCEQLERVENVVALQGEVLNVIREGGSNENGGDDGIEQLAPGKPLSIKMEGLKALMAGVMKQLSATSGMLSLEFSFGKWSSDDVKDVIDPLTSVVARSLGLQSFAKLVWRTAELQRQSRDEMESPKVDPTSTVTSTTSTQNSTGTSNDAYLLRQIISLNLQYETSHHLRISDVLPIVDSATLELREAIINAVAATRKNLQNVNQHRWTKHPDLDRDLGKELDDAYERLTGALREFTQDRQSTTRMRLLGPFLSLLQSKGMTKEEQEALPMRSLFISFVLGTNLVSLSESILKTMDVAKGTLAKRKKNRLWAPKGLRKLGNLFLTREVGGDDEDGARVLGEDTMGRKGAGEDVPEDKANKSYRHDPDSRPPANVIQKIMNRLHGLYKWCGTPEAIFAFKYSFVSVAIWFPAVVNQTAGFYYKEKGLWALIMAQTTLNIYASDQMYNLVVRALGTVIGAAIGLAAWYMGNGHGIGNPYGAAAATGLFLLPVVFLRIFAPPQYLPGVILFCATFALVVGYSWVDGHIAQFATPGIGWTIAWKRFTLVIIGAAASFIIMMLPPTSSRKAVRQRNASTISGLGHLYAFLMSTWISNINKEDESDSDSSSAGEDEELGKTNGNEQKSVQPDTETARAPAHSRRTLSSRWIDGFRRQLLTLSEELTALRQLTTMATWEGNIRGKWPVEEYNALLTAETEMLTGLAQLGNALAHLDDEWRVTFIHNTRVLNPHFISEVLTMISLISQSLRTGEPLHLAHPQKLVGRLLYHNHNHNYLHNVSSAKHDPRQLLTVETVSSLDYMYYATGIVAVFLVLSSIDDLHKITKRLCGEVPFKGFEDWRNRFESEHI